MAKYLIVNADDYGIAASVSQGIRESHQRGIVTSTTVMIGMDNAAEAVQQALKETPDLALGLHLVVAGKAQKPVLPPDQILTLVRPDGFFYDHPAWGEHAPSFNPDEMMREVHAQFERFVAVANRLPTQLDSHYHATYFHLTAGSGSVRGSRSNARYGVERGAIDRLRNRRRIPIMSGRTILWKIMHWTGAHSAF